MTAGQFFNSELFGNKSEAGNLDRTKATKVYLIDLDDVIPNRLNFYADDEESIESLAENIKINGIVQSLTGYMQNGKCTLLSGHRRFAAINRLIETQCDYSYNGMIITGKVPIVMVTSPSDDASAVLAIIHANHQREMTPEEKKVCIRKTLEALNEKEKNGTFVWPIGVRTRDVLAQETGIAVHFIKDYLAETGLSKKTPEGNMPEFKSKEIRCAHVSCQSPNSIYRSVKSFSRKIKNVNWDSFEDHEKVLEIETELQNLLEIITEHLNERC